MWGREGGVRIVHTCELMRLILLAIAGAAGTLLRYGIANAMGSVQPARFPFATLTVNLTGSLLIGVAASTITANETVRIVVITGLLGGFTTYSAFNEEVLQLVRSGAWMSAGVYVAATLVGGLIAGATGYALATRMRMG